MIKQIEAETGAKVSIEQDGTIFIAAVDGAGGDRAAEMIRSITAEVSVGEKYKGRVTRLMGMGAFVEILPGKEGLVHTSNLSEQEVRRPDDVVKVGDEIEVRVIEIDPQGRVNLTAVGLDQPFDPSMVRPREERRGGFGGPRGGDRGSRGGFGGPRGGGFGGPGRDREREPDRPFRGAPAHTSSAEPRPEEDEVPKARFRPRR
jgi:polyribonucleotide nucleotidyltransferase